jgi:hypothetical protein
MEGDTRIQNLFVTLNKSVGLFAGSLREIPAGACLSGPTRMPFRDYDLNPCVGVEVAEWGLGNEAIRFLHGKSNRPASGPKALPEPGKSC